MRHPVTSFPLNHSAPPKKYRVRSFFTALHIVLTECLPRDQSFKEYLQIFLLIAYCLRHIFSDLKLRCLNIKVPTTISLLVVTSSPNHHNKPFCSRASIGFSACGTNSERSVIINDRYKVIPELQHVKLRKDHPKPGNCAEIDIFCHFNEFVPLVRDGSENCEHVIAVTSTLNLMLGRPEKNCTDCRKLIELVRKRYKFLRVLDLAPLDLLQ